MKKRILWITPGGRDEFDAPIREYLERHASSTAEVDVVSMPRGPHHLEHQYYCALAVPDILHRIKAAEIDGYDAAIIGGFYDLGLWEAREIAERIVVAAPSEACLHIASTLGNSFSVIVGHKFWIPKMAENVARYGYAHKLASFKSIDVGVSELQRSRRDTYERMLAAAKEAVEQDLAEVIVLGCTIEFGFFKELQDELHVPVLDPVLATCRFAELLVELRDSFGWLHSKMYSYRTPASTDIRRWGLAKQYGFDERIWK